MKLTLSDLITVAVSPPQYGEDPAGRWWGFFQFPDLWRGNDGVLYLAVNVGADSAAGRHEPTQVFCSRDGGGTWQRVAFDATDRSPEIITLPDGRQVAFGRERYLYHLAELSPDAGRASIDVVALGLTPVAGPFRGGYKVNEYLVYRYGDIPAACRRFPLASRASANAAWAETSGVVEYPEMRLPVLTRAMWWDDAGREEWREFPPRLKPPAPHEVTVLPDGTLLWVLESQHPEVERHCGMVSCLASCDAGRTWTRRGGIADGRAWSWGATNETSLARMPDGDLLCVIRTKNSNEAGDTHHLAAARSADEGRTWTMLPPLAEFSVTPHLLTLGNGKVAVVYGRPGVHVKA
ncbi:MAG: sialidase family protein [bacterium]